MEGLLMMFSRYMLSRIGERTHPWRTPGVEEVSVDVMLENCAA